ncbi:MAG: efflux transporter outer membrane subunit [Burkholderiales bacterium]|nr:efflux transporter outer membrane subunit [Burkholderiales bacterium]
MKSSMRILPVAAAALLAGGCSMIPTYERPAPPVAAAFPYAPTTAGTPAAQLPWESFFSDPRLRKLIQTALQNNRDLRVAVLNMAQARAQYDIRNADRLPTVGLNASATRAPNALGKEANTYTVNLGISSWEIDFFGRVAALSQAALAQYLATEEGRKAAQISLVASVANTWLALAADEELLKLTQDTVATREETLRLTKLRFDNGVASELDYRLALSLTESARAALAQTRRQRANDLDALALLVGQPVGPDFTVGVTTLDVKLPDVPAGLPSQVLVNRPDVRQAEQLLIATNANIGAARAAFFPRISLTAGAGTASSQLSGLFKDGSWVYTVAPSLVQTVFDAGRNRANLSSAEAARDIAVAQYERAIQQAFRDVSDALAGRATYGEQVRAQGAVVEAESTRFRLARLRYESGVASYLDLLDAQRSLFTAQTALVQSRLQGLQNQVQLYRSLGGGWTEPKQ